MPAASRWWPTRPDDTITLHDNTIGGSGRVRAGAGRCRWAAGQVDPMLSGTGRAAASALSGGYFGKGRAPVTLYTVTANAGGSIGSGNLLVSWTDGTNSGQLAIGDGYLSPRPVAVGN